MALNNDIVKDELKIFPLRMDLYKDSEALYTSDREELGNNYGFSVSKSRGIAIPITGESVSQGMQHHFNLKSYIISEISLFFQQYWS